MPHAALEATLTMKLAPLAARECRAGGSGMEVRQYGFRPADTTVLDSSIPALPCHACPVVADYPFPPLIPTGWAEPTGLAVRYRSPY